MVNVDDDYDDEYMAQIGLGHIDSVARFTKDQIENEMTLVTHDILYSEEIGKIMVSVYDSYLHSDR